MYDVVVIGAGNAGVESASAVARAGGKVALITFSKDNIGELSCNPSIGGVAKGTIVREIDAMDGLMGKCADLSGTHFKILNASKGPAVHSPRCQIDRKLYKKNMLELLQQYKNLTIIEDEVIDITVENNTVSAVVLEIGGKIICKSVIVATGTFLNGIIHIGCNYDKEAGRVNEKPSKKLANFFRKYNFSVGRLKTGTPARIIGDSIDYSDLEKQNSDEIPKPFSYMNNKITVPQLDCYITYTNKATHKVILENIKQSAMYGGKIHGIGPRYCPSIEDKLMRFGDKERHQIFLEKEGFDSDLVYPNGISTSLPQDIQEKFIHTIKGLENCKIARYAYAIEYDFIDPRELKPTLETKKIKNLFFAGQINGTTGYEEAGGQGVVAGINAISSKPFVLTRDNSFIGVLIDDLTRLGTTEPYRMFTSRAEYRLFIRADNADLRLTEKAIDFSVISEDRKQVFMERKNKIDRAKEKMLNCKISSSKLSKYDLNIKQDGSILTAFHLLSYQQINLDTIKTIFPELTDIDEKTGEQIKIDAIYEPYVKRQQDDIKLLEKEKNIIIPDNFDYDSVGGLTAEVKEKLKKHKPYNIEIAGRISGITPASIVNILVALKNSKNR